MSDIFYDSVDKRKYYRLTNPVKVTIEGKIYKTLDWSISSFRIAEYLGELAPGQETDAEIEINFQGFTVKFSQKIKAIRLDGGNLVAEYIDPSSRNREILSYFSRGLISGEFQPFDEVIKHIDIPVSDGYLNSEFGEENVKYPKRSLIVFIFLLFGIFVLLYVFNLIYKHTFIMPVEAAVVTVKTDVLNSPAKGIISRVFVKEGEKVKQGEPLFIVNNPESVTKIQNIKTEILKNEVLLKEKQQQLDSGIHQQKIAYLQDELDKKNLLYKKKIVSRPEIDDLRLEILQYKDDFAKLQSEKARLEDIIEINKKELVFYELLNRNNTVIAPYDGELEEVIAFRGQNTDEKTPLMVIRSTSSEKFLEASLETRQPHHLLLNSRVNIEIPLYKLKVEGRLVRVQKDDNHFTATIKPTNSDLLRDVNIGTPARVSFARAKFYE